jgi:hypothetical protein
VISRLKPYRKAIVAILGGVLTATATFVAPGSTWGHVIAIALLALTAAGVYAAPNTKPIPAAVAAVLANVPKP